MIDSPIDDNYNVGGKPLHTVFSQPSSALSLPIVTTTATIIIIIIVHIRAYKHRKVLGTPRTYNLCIIITRSASARKRKWKERRNRSVWFFSRYTYSYIQYVKGEPPCIYTYDSSYRRLLMGYSRDLRFLAFFVTRASSRARARTAHRTQRI